MTTSRLAAARKIARPKRTLTPEMVLAIKATARTQAIVSSRIEGKYLIPVLSEDGAEPTRRSA